LDSRAFTSASPYAGDLLAGFCLGLASVVAVATVTQNLHGLNERRSRADLSSVLVLAVAALLAAQCPPPKAHVELRVTRPQLDAESTTTLVARVPRHVEKPGRILRAPINVVIVGNIRLLTQTASRRGMAYGVGTRLITTQIHGPIFPQFRQQRAGTLDV